MTKKANRTNDTEKSFQLSRCYKIAMGVALFLLAFSFVAPFLFTPYSIVDMSKYVQIGDTLGGIMNPFIAASSVIVTLLAFYMQVRTNQLQRELFNEQIQKSVRGSWKN